MFNGDYMRPLLSYISTRHLKGITFLASIPRRYTQSDLLHLTSLEEKQKSINTLKKYELQSILLIVRT
jgi:hypothetical protein